MTLSINKHEYFIQGRAAFIAALEHPAGPDAGVMFAALVDIVSRVVYFLPDDDEEFEGECGPTGSVYTEGTEPVPGKTYDIRQTLATITEAVLERLEAGWESVRGYKGNSPEESFETGLELLAELREFVAEG